MYRVCRKRQTLYVFSSLSKNFQLASDCGIIEETGVLLWNDGKKMEEAK